MYIQEQIMKRPTFAYLDTLETSQWHTRAQIERLQMQKLKALLRNAAEHSPWHADRIRAAGLDDSNGATEYTLDDLRRLPTMSKQDARANVNRIVSVNGSGDGSERIHVAGDANQVRRNVPNDGQHGSAAVAEFGFAEEWDKGRVGFGEFQLKWK